MIPKKEGLLERLYNRTFIIFYPLETTIMLLFTNVALILKLAFQTSIYAIWKEMNGRIIHSQVARPSSSLILDIKISSYAS